MSLVHFQVHCGSIFTNNVAVILGSSLVFKDYLYLENSHVSEKGTFTDYSIFVAAHVRYGRILVCRDNVWLV